MFTLRHYQDRIKQKVYSLYRKGVKFILIVLPTGSGKTVLFSSIAYEMAVVGMILDLVRNVTEKLPTAIVVHREELIGQISLTLAKVKIYHNLIIPPATIDQIIKLHRMECGQSFYNSQSTLAVVSVDTFNSRWKSGNTQLIGWAESVRFWICDEAAHVLRENKWGRCLLKFTNAIGLGVTATPERLDRKGLGTPEIGGHGLFQEKVEGPQTYWMIKEGYLSDFEVATPEGDFVEHLGENQKDKDFSPEQMRVASGKSTLTGDVVRDYLRYAKGKQAIYFVIDTEDAKDILKKFLAAGVKAEFVNAESLKSVRYGALQRFRNRETQVLINIDLFDEGLDVVGIEVVGMARPTASLGKVLQMYGRGLRPVYAKGYDLTTREGRLAAQANGPKPKCLLIDHVGNIRRHGPPNANRVWSLKGSNGKKKKLTKDCWNVPDCGLPFLRILSHCPKCGSPAIDPNSLPKGGGRIPPALVDGDLRLIDSQTLKELYEKSQPKSPALIGQERAAMFGPAIGRKAMADEEDRNRVHKELYEKIALWTGQLVENGYDIDMVHKEFYSQFNMTIMEALSLRKAQLEKIIEELI